MISIGILLVCVHSEFEKKLFAGTDAEKEQLKAGVEKTENFLADMKDITATQSREVDATQRNTLELFAWVEEAKTRQMKLKDPK